MATFERIAVSSDFARKHGADVLGGRKLVVISNRAPIKVIHEDGEERIEPTVGGVGTTFLRLLEHHGGTWIAWNGGQKTPARLSLPTEHPRFDLSFIELSERDVSQYYYGLCNRALWPLMHFMISNCHFNGANWRQYSAVNEIFARAAIEQAEPGDALWIQDFHLALTPQLVRARRDDLSIGIFWHVPFPPVEVFRVFPWRRELLIGMLGSNLVGFHCDSYARHFLSACQQILDAEIDPARGEVHYEGHTSRVGAFPLGIPVDYFESVAASPRTQQKSARIRRGLRSELIVLGVDRLDYTKGILERLLGFERFLERNPHYHKRVTLVLIAVPSRTKVAEYAALKRQLDKAVGRVVGRFSSDGWVPIRYLYTQFGAEDLVSYYQAADVALLTPLRDGMNLVAKEFVASHPADDAVLILSEFAGAAEELTDALLVNPYNADAIADRLREALDMRPEARAQRMRALREKIQRNNLEQWSRNFLTSLTAESRIEPRRIAHG
ncbi:MAG TPA: trehalose-6-phosphate synthase [Candidatus Binataceae bacterium]|nr:trehalose-6-phosphate synthase [Candidatus Binataceae bacterium]